MRSCLACIVPPALLRLGLQPYLSLLELRHPIDELLGKLKRQKSIETAAASNAVLPSREWPTTAIRFGSISLSVSR